MNSNNFNNVYDSNIFYCCHKFKFYFSSELRQHKFKENAIEFAKNETYKLMYRYNLNIDFDSFCLLFLFSYYNKIEKRGFRVEQYRDEERKQLVRTILEFPKFDITGVA